MSRSISSSTRVVRPAEQLQQRLSYTFKQPSLLEQALTHRSHGSAHNERLEFLGDSVLNCAVADLLYTKFSKLNEGDLSRVRANLVKQQALFEIAQTLELSHYLHLGEGELKSGGLRRPSILADALEAIIGAVFIDGGFEAARKILGRLYTTILAHIDPQTLGKDDKTLLQEYLQANKFALPQYTVIATHGAAHSQQFEVECSVPELDIKVLGNGASRRAAEQVAANLALAIVRQKTPRVAKRSRTARTSKKTEVDPQLALKLKS